METGVVDNAIGRAVPTVINGAAAIPFKGIGKHRPSGAKASPPIRTSSDYPDDGNKVVPDLQTALQRAGLRDGMTISSHHHIEGSMNGPLGDYCSHGKMRGMGVLRSHGGRWQSVQDGEVHIDPHADLDRQAEALGDILIRY